MVNKIINYAIFYLIDYVRFTNQNLRLFMFLFNFFSFLLNKNKGLMFLWHVKQIKNSKNESFKI